MTSKVSNKKFSPVLHNFECGVKSKTKLAIIIGILHLAAAPAVIIAMIAEIYSKHIYDYEDAFAVICVVTTALAGFLGIFLAIDSFSCLHTRSVVDMKMSLPLTAKQRFFSNYLSGLVMYIGPFLAAQIVSLLCMAYGFIFMEGRTFQSYQGTGLNNEPVYLEYVCHDFSGSMPILLKLILCGVLTMLMLYTLTVLVTVCCGSKFESIAYTILINIIIPLTIFLCYMSMFQDLFGINVRSIIAQLVMHTSPAGGIVAAIFWNFGTPYVGNRELELPQYWTWAVIYLLLTAAMGAAAYFLYTKRRAEQVSKPFVFKLIYYIISSAAVFCIYSLFYGNDMGLVPAIITTAIVYLILEVATNRGFKKVWLSLIKYAGVMAASVLIVFAAQKTEGFGMVTRVPDASNVESIDIHYNGFYDMFGQGYVSIDYSGMYEDSIKITDRENINTIVSAHQSLVDNRNYDGEFACAGISLCYRLKNGSDMLRYYLNTAPEAAEILSRIDLTDEYKTQIADRYKKIILTEKEYYLKNAEYEPDYYYNVTAHLNQTQGNISTASNGENNGGIKISFLIDKGFFEQLADAYTKDIMNISEENYYKSAFRNRYNLYFVSKCITVPESFTNTMELLEYFGFDTVKTEDYSDRDINDHLNDAVKSERIAIFTAAEWKECLGVPEGVRTHGSYVYKYYYNDKEGKAIRETSAELCELYRRMQPMNIVPENGYIISVFGESGAVPAEMNGIAEKIYAEAAAAKDTEYNNETAFGLHDSEAVQEVPTGTTAYTVY